ncbi:MAG: DUF3078 domain-containing protein [Candidatus Krumholzibacteria bacterium]|nr:DUF3078 domain-containing protein [Candidatus Krumholzibacteria bacterium]
MFDVKRWVAVLMVLVLSTGLAGLGVAQDDAEEGPQLGVWQKEIDASLNILQSAYSNNWNGGDKGSAVWNGQFSARLEKQYTETTNWRNILKLAYGQTHSQERGENGELHWQKPDKTDDIIDLESMFRWTLGKRWDPYVSFRFQSMFEDLSDMQERALTFNPLKFKEAVGISRTFVKEENRWFMTRVGVALIQNSRKYYLDETFEAEIGREATYEAAAEWITEYRVGALDDRVDWESKLSFIMPFVYSGKSTFEDGFIVKDPDGNIIDNPFPEDIAGYSTTIDVDFENTFTANITKVISVKLYVRWVYDKYDNTVGPVVGADNVLINTDAVHQAIRKAGQFKQTLALGFGYKWN